MAITKKVIFLANKDNVLYNFRKEVILAVKEQGYEVILNCPYGKKIDYFIERGCRFINIAIDRRGTNVFNDLKLIWDYFKLLKEEKPDVVLTYTGKPSFYGSFVCGLLGVPHIINNAGVTQAGKLLTFILETLYRVCERKANCIMFQNTYERDYTRNLVGNDVPYRDIPGSGVNLEEFTYQPYPENDNVVTFNYVARIVALKGIDEFLACAKIIKNRHSNVRFVIYGDYDDDKYRQQIAQLQEQGVVEYGGVQMDMKPAIATAHAVIHPSHYEGMTNVILEHSAVGRPCLASDIPGCREGVDDGETGFLFRVQDVASMVEAVEKFLALSYAEKAEMGRRAREKMVRQFDRRIVTDIYLEEIQKIVGK